MKRLSALFAVSILLICFQLSFAQSQGPIATERTAKTHKEQDKSTVKEEERDKNQRRTDARPFVVKIINPDMKQNVPPLGKIVFIDGNGWAWRGPTFDRKSPVPLDQYPPRVR